MLLVFLLQLLEFFEKEIGRSLFHPDSDSDHTRFWVGMCEGEKL